MFDIRPDNSALRSASMGESLADQVTEALRQADTVRVDLACVEMMTPSFANALVMTLLDRFPLATLQTRCAFVNRAEPVIDVMNRAVRRYQSGIRLTAQLPVGA